MDAQSPTGARNSIPNAYGSTLYSTVFADANLDLEPWSWYILGSVGSHISWQFKEAWRYSPPKSKPHYLRFRAFLLRNALRKLGETIDKKFTDQILGQLNELESWEERQPEKQRPTRLEFETASLAAERIRHFISEIVRVQLETNPYFLLGIRLQCCITRADTNTHVEFETIKELAGAANLILNEPFLKCTRLSNLRPFAARENALPKDLEIALNGFVMEGGKKEKGRMPVISLVEELELISETIEWWLRGLPRLGSISRKPDLSDVISLDESTGTFTYRGERWNAKLKRNSVVMRRILEAVVEDGGVSEWIKVRGFRIKRIKNACDHFNRLNKEAKGRFMYKKGDGHISHSVRIVFRT